MVIIPAAAYAQDNARPTYTWQKPAKIVTFNSITNNPTEGDERYFLKSRTLDTSTYGDNLKVTDGQEIVLRVYYDNNAATNFALKSKNTRVRIVIPATSTKNETPTAYIMSDNAKPTIVSDTTALTADHAFSLKYESGSAQIWNNVLRGDKLPDAVVSQNGTQIGYDKLDGTVQGGARYSGYVTLKVKVQFAVTTASTGSVGVVGGVPNTGPGQVAGLFLAATAIGAIAHRAATSRRKV